jgi:hypothetical protein
MKKVPQLLISLELWNKKLQNCQTISKLNAYFDPIKGDLIRVLVDDIKSSYSCIISSVALVDATHFSYFHKTLKKNENTKLGESQNHLKPTNSYSNIVMQNWISQV